MNGIRKNANNQEDEALSLFRSNALKKLYQQQYANYIIQMDE